MSGGEMWIFGYGSLMWDEWETKFDGHKIDSAILPNYRRDFNKKSTVNWGKTESPAPTLGLEESQNAECTGSAFEFADDKEDVVLEYLTQREGTSFDLKKLTIILPDDRSIQAFVPVNRNTTSTYLGNLSINRRAEMARDASGTSGNCIDYVANIRNKLLELNIKDENVEGFWQAIQSIDSA